MRILSCHSNGWAFWVAALCVTLSSFLAGQESKADWPQWRGPTRDGIAPAGPKLLDAWPASGPKQLWKSAYIPSYWLGGCGSVVVAEGKVFVYVNWRHGLDSAEDVRKWFEDLGWVSDMPKDLSSKVEEARQSLKFRTIGGAELDAHIKKFLEPLDPELVKKFGNSIEKRLSKFKEGPPWGTMKEILDRIADKTYGNSTELIQAITGGNVDAGYIPPAKKITDTVVCLDAATGKEVWNKEFPSTNALVFCGASSTPAISGGKCYAAGSQGLYCLSTKDGSVVWQNKLKDLTHSSPMVINGAVVILLNEGLSAYNAENGQLLWQQPGITGGRAELYGGPGSSPIKWTVNKHDYIICTAAGGPFCVEPENGKIVWKASKESSNYECRSTAVLVGDDILAIHARGAAFAYKINPQGAELMWRVVNCGDHGASPVVYQGLMYCFGRSYAADCARCLDLKTGEVKWIGKQGNQDGDWSCSSPIVADGKIISNAGPSHYDAVRTRLFKATADKYEETGKIPQPVCNSSSPAIVEGKLYLRMKDSIACYDLTEAGNR